MGNIGNLACTKEGNKAPGMEAVKEVIYPATPKSGHGPAA